MPLNAAEQSVIQALVERASPAVRLAMEAESKELLSEVNRLMQSGRIDAETTKEMEFAIETLVRIESTASGKGWLFRGKRRVQLFQMYLGSDLPLGGLIAGDVNDDAVRLKLVCDRIVERYVGLSEAELKNIVAAEFTADRHYSSGSSVAFTYSDLPDFEFTLDDWLRDGDRTLTVHSGGRYAGFLLQVSGEHWTCSVKDGVAYKATGGAKKLSETMVRKFGVRDLSHLEKMMRGRRS